MWVSDKTLRAALFIFLAAYLILFITLLVSFQNGLLSQTTTNLYPLSPPLRQESLGHSFGADLEGSLIIGIPTVPRAQRYLSATLASIVEQLPSSTTNQSPRLWENRIAVYVINNRPGEHTEFEELRDTLASVPELLFINKTMPVRDMWKDALPEPDDFNNPDDRPGSKVRRQTYDLIAMLDAVIGQSEYFMFMEDDFPLCSDALDTFHYIIHKANLYLPNWNAIRTCYGMNGILVRGSELPSLKRFLEWDVARRPPDGLIVEWMCGGPAHRSLTLDCNPQRHMTFRYALFHHIGNTSSLRQTGIRDTPACWQWYSGLLWEIDAYNVGACGEDDLWPCVRFSNDDTTQYTYQNSYLVPLNNSDTIEIVRVFRDRPDTLPDAAAGASADTLPPFKGFPGRAYQQARKTG